MFERYEETYEVVLSPRRDRAALLINWATNTSGVPIFDTRTGDTAYHVSALRNTKGAHFSANGNTLYLIGQTTSGSVPSAVIAVSAASGAELWRFEFSEWIVDSAFDPAAGMLYLVSADAYSARSDTPEVYVLDTATPELLGRMQASVGGTQGCDYPNTIVGPDGVFYLCNEQVWRFDRVE